MKRRRAGIDRRRPSSLSEARQCRLLGIKRSGLYYQPKAIVAEDLALMKLIDRQYLATPVYGARKMAVWLGSQGKRVNRKRVQRLMRLMGLRAVYRRPRTPVPVQGQRRFPYLLRGLEVIRPNQVWAADITYIPVARGFLYLVVIIDWHSRYVLTWLPSNTLNAGFGIDVLEGVPCREKPEICNMDQGSHFSTEAFTRVLERQCVSISMDGKGSYNHRLCIERVWCTVNYEQVYLMAYLYGREAKTALADFFLFYNNDLPHQALGYRSPGAVYNSSRLDNVPLSLTASKGAPRTAASHVNIALVPKAEFTSHCPPQCTLAIPLVPGYFYYREDNCGYVGTQQVAWPTTQRVLLCYHST